MRYRSGTIGSMKENIHVRIDEDVMTGVRAFAAENGLSLAAAMSVLLRLGLKAPVGATP